MRCPSLFRRSSVLQLRAPRILGWVRHPTVSTRPRQANSRVSASTAVATMYHCQVLCLRAWLSRFFLWFSSCPRTRDVIAAELGWRCCETSKIREEANIESRTASKPAKRYRKTRMPRIRSGLAQAAPRTVLTRRSSLSFPKIGKALATADAYFIPASGYRHCLPRCVCRLRGFAPHEPGSGREFRYVTAMRRSF